MREKNELIPFGKYKGRQIEEILADRDYVEWLQAQSWFPEKYPAIHQVVINYQGEPEETPEHNAMQVCFIKSNYQQAFIQTMFPGFFGKREVEYQLSDPDKWPEKPHKKTEILDVTFDCLERLRVEAEYEGFDLLLECGCSVSKQDTDGCWYYYGSYYLITKQDCGLIEIKPSLSDDYPAVLRQIKNNLQRYKHSKPKPVLIVGQYHGKGASWDEVVQIFALSGIKAVLMAEIEANLPNINP